MVSRSPSFPERDRVLDLCLALVSLVGVLVPPSHRRDWCEEWSGEIYYRWLRLRKFDRLNLKECTDPTLRSFGAIPHALWMWREDWSVDMLIQDLGTRFEPT